MYNVCVLIINAHGCEECFLLTVVSGLVEAKGSELNGSCPLKGSVLPPPPPPPPPPAAAEPLETSGVGLVPLVAGADEAKGSVLKRSSPLMLEVMAGPVDCGRRREKYIQQLQ